jgi:hypothetical protein
MNDHVIEEMADAISTELHIPNEDVLRILHHYWQDKIAPIWQVDDLLETALNAGIPITKDDAVAVLKDLFEGHDAELGISWITLEVALQEYHLDWKHLPEDRYPEIQGVFKVWRKGNLIAHQIGMFPDETKGNLTKAIVLAKTLAMETPDVPIMLGCEAWHSRAVEPWLTVTQIDEALLIEQKEPTCTP